MDFGNIKKKHIIIGTSALVLIAGGITAGVIANNSDEQATNANIAEIQPTTEQVTTTATTVTTKATTTTSATTTTTVKTTKKAKKTEKKEDKSDSSKTEVKDDNNTSYEDDNNYDKPQHEEPVKQETPKPEEPKHEEPAPAPAPEPEPDPEPLGVGAEDGCGPYGRGWFGYEADLFNYALNQGCAAWQADAYVWAVKTNGQDVVFIGNPNPNDPESFWGIWIYDASTGTYWT